MIRTARVAALALVLLALAACRREDRNYRPAQPFADSVRYFEEYEGNAYALAEGKRLFSAFNCVGCHGHGGGGMGPPLMDEKWFYGSAPDEIFDTISKGRPNGMPAFGGVAREPEITVAGTVPEYQRWQLVAYVRSMSGLAPMTTSPGRDDHMQTRPPEHSTDPRPPTNVPPPPDVVGPPK